MNCVSAEFNISPENHWIGENLSLISIEFQSNLTRIDIET